jgi:crotonobetainyl-CoA:carnitine CoA-transferase CaiB-like acyl-CoA transferase
MRGHGTHIWMCVALVVVALVLVASTGSGTFFVLPLLGCMLMMGAMMWMMMGAMGGRGGPSDRS